MIWSGGEARAARLAKCTECGQTSGPYWVRWHAYRVDDPEADGDPEIAFYCATCADREFERPPRRRLDERHLRPREIDE